ncbi:hypothetical protein B0J11DRAFT_537357 [Dendryphion nanum]|uniref:WXG100 family type VII secretion target n=1 Tax=Dendryphion nanum TaxID=256645 RepID=A0A9P9DAA4_9PLEO|nr:hypothetical protein B0J11DRAFT_537357 [Dendryphion nanum]
MQLFSTLLFLLPALTLAASVKERAVAINYAQIEALRNQISSTRRQYAASAASIRSNLNIVLASWSGSASQATNRAAQEFEASLNDALHALNNIEQQLALVASDYEQNENQNKNKWSKE